MKAQLLKVVGSGENLEKILYLNLQRKGPVRQEPAYCLHCRRPVDVLDLRVKTLLRDLELGGHTFTMVDPECPDCGRLLQVRYYVVH